MIQLATIGYEGADPGSFDDVLVENGIDCLVDVRAVAVSRKRGFSKSALAERVQERGIRYVHLRSLGDPKEGREAARSGYWTSFLRIFNDHLETVEAKAGLVELAALVREHRVALLCYEADASTCHRTLIAERLNLSTNLSMLHLSVGRDRDQRAGHREDSHPCEGMAAA